jgi:hypothetical protein
MSTQELINKVVEAIPEPLQREPYVLRKPSSIEVQRGVAPGEIRILGSGE